MKKCGMIMKKLFQAEPRLYAQQKALLSLNFVEANKEDSKPTFSANYISGTEIDILGF